MPAFQSGMITLLSDDKIAFKLDRRVLKKASRFKDEDTPSFELHVPANKATVLLFLLHLTEPARHYQCDAVARDILHMTALRDPGDKRFDIFVLACELDDIPSGCRVLLHARHAESPSSWGAQIRPTSSSWTKANEAQLSPSWAYALECGVRLADKKCRYRSPRVDTSIYRSLPVYTGRDRVATGRDSSTVPMDGSNATPCLFTLYRGPIQANRVYEVSGGALCLKQAMHCHGVLSCIISRYTSHNQSAIALSGGNLTIPFQHIGVFEFGQHAVGVLVLRLRSYMIA
ncbi:uncharacterized protein MKK02DRAFT_30083 [Dioszegia hungarica]|uniref:Uncharacterized protein n=1 Tax=Dioszegia hungarica TaxID=4972 RepID=A0AA38H1G6_9TREE|nr:uncharacterized protein MKK02DRAFT_30083 [Dioszegia hungarica]KAI9632215.1 hypothetical protein MKK02DRAFT_30083 [Dioszegia hungarica]